MRVYVLARERGYFQPARRSPVSREHVREARAHRSSPHGTAAASVSLHPLAAEFWLRAAGPPRERATWWCWAATETNPLRRSG